LLKEHSTGKYPKMTAGTALPDPLWPLSAISERRSFVH